MSASTSREQNSSAADIVDLTFSDDSESDMGDDMSQTVFDADEKPPIPITSGSSPISSFQRSEHSDDNDLGAILSSIRKRKRQPEPNYDVAPQKPKPAVPSTFSLERCHAFFGNNLKKGASLFGTYQPTSMQSAEMAFQGSGAPEDRANKVENEMIKDEKLVDSPYQLMHIREIRKQRSQARHEVRRRSKTGRDNLKVSGQILVSQRASDKLKTPRRSEAIDAIQPAVQRASSCDPPPLKKPRPSFSTLTASKKKKIAPAAFPNKVAFTGPTNATQPCNTGSETNNSRPAPSNAHRDGSEESIFGSEWKNPAAPQGQGNATVPSNTSSTAMISGTTARRDRAKKPGLAPVRSRVTAVAFDSKDATSTTTSGHRRRPGTSSRPTTGGSGQGERQPPEALEPSTLQGSFGPERRPEQRPAYALPTEDKWETILKLGKPSAAKKAKRTGRLSNLVTQVHQQTRPHNEPSQARRGNNNATHVENQLLRAQKSVPRQSSGVTASQRPLLPTPGEQSQCENQPILQKTNTAIVSQRIMQNEPQSELRESTKVNSESTHQPSGNQLVISMRNRLPQPPQAKQTVGVPNRAQPRRPHVTREEYSKAEAQMKALQAQHEKENTTILVDALPADFGMPKPDHLSRRRAVLNTSVRERDETKRHEELVKRNLREVSAAVRKQYADKSEVFQRETIQKKHDKYLLGKSKRDQNKRGQSKREQLQKTFLNEDFLEDTEAGKFNGEEVDLNARKIPASQALDKQTIVVCYVVYMTEPITRGENHENSWKRTKAFGNLRAASIYAKRLLEVSCSSSSAHPTAKAKQAVAQSIWHRNGLLCGFIELNDGKLIYVEVQKDQQLVGDLQPDVLRSKYVDEEVLELYRPRYDIWLITVSPKAWLDEEKKDMKAKEKRDRHEERREQREKKSEAKRKGKPSPQANATNNQPEAEEDQAQGLEGARLRAALNAFGTTDAEDLDDDDEISSQATDDSVLSSASEGTVRCSSPAFGPLYSRFPDHYNDVVHVPRHLNSCTDLRQANEQALRLAKDLWRPRNTNLEAWDAYNSKIEHLEEQRDQADLDSELLIIPFHVPSYYGRTDYVPFGFVASKIMVVETKLKGPRDIGVDFVMDLDENPFRPTAREAAMDDAQLAGDLESMGEAGNHEDYDGGDSDDEDGQDKGEDDFVIVGDDDSSDVSEEDEDFVIV